MAVARVGDDLWFEDSEEARTPLRVVAPTPLRQGVPVSRRRAARARMLRRRRRFMLGVAAVVTLVVLAWPGHAFGGVIGAGVLSDQGADNTLGAGQVYVVQPGDSVRSIAQLVNAENPAAARRALVAELHSSVVVPGEHVLIP